MSRASPSLRSGRSAGLRPETLSPQSLGHSAAAADAGVLPLARELGDKLGAAPIPPVQPIINHQFRPTRADLWPPEVWDEMQAIYRGETQ